MRRLAGILANALCALTGHPEALDRRSMGVLRREVREMLASGEVSTVQVGCICGRKMKAVDPRWDWHDEPARPSRTERLVAWLVIASIILVIAGVRL